MTFGAAGCGGAVPVVAAVDSGLVAGPHDHVTVCKDVPAPANIATPEQRG